MNRTAIDALGHRLGHTALTTLVRLCPETRQADTATLEAACAAMRAEAPAAIDALLDDAEAAPHLAQIAFASAVMTLVNAAIPVIRRAN